MVITHKKRIYASIALGATVIGTMLAVAYRSPVNSHAITRGSGHSTVIMGSNDMYFTWNPKASTVQSQWYGSTWKFYKDVYFPNNPKDKSLPGGFVWYSLIAPPGEMQDLSAKDYGKMYENAHNLTGNGGSELVTSGNWNIKKGAVNPETQSYLGDNTGTSQILAGTYKGKYYEYRYLGYSSLGGVIPNPYFPADVGLSNFQGNTVDQTDLIFAHFAFEQKYWSPDSKAYPYFKQWFGAESPVETSNTEDTIESWIEQYFLPAHPEFKAIAKQRLKNAGYKYDEKSIDYYWAQRLQPMTDPSKETGIWLGMHWVNGVASPFYVSLVSAPPKQPNMRIVDYKVYDSSNKLVAEEKRGTAYDSVDGTATYNEKSLVKGATYHIEADVENMPDVKQNIHDSITLDEMYSYDSDIGLATKYTVQKNESQTAQDPYSSELPSGKTATFKYDYTVPKDGAPTKDIQLNARVPEKFFLSGENTNTNDDVSTLQFKISPENLKVNFDGYFDANKQPVNYVQSGQEMYVEYTMTKDEGTQAVTNPSLTVQNTDEATVTTNQTVQPSAVYDKNGRVIPDGKMTSVGDYAVYWVPFAPQVPKICSQANIPPQYAQEGVNDDPSDDVAKAPCLASEDNIVVSDFSVTPKLITVGKGQQNMAQSVTVNYLLGNINNDHSNKDIPLVYTVDGHIVATDTKPVSAGQTLPVSMVLTSNYFTPGKSHVVQVEANPEPRKYIEYVVDSSGNPVYPYKDNIGYDMVNVVQDSTPIYCQVPHTSNQWTTKFYLHQWHGVLKTGTYTTTDKQGHEHTHHYQYCETTSQRSWTQTVNFNETMNITHVYFRSKYTKDLQGGWVDILNQPGVIKAGYGYEVQIVTLYNLGGFTSVPTPWESGCNGLSVNPTMTPVNATDSIKVTLPFNDSFGNPVSWILQGTQAGPWYTRTSTYQFDDRTVIDHPEDKLYVSPNTRNGDYTMKIQTEPFYGSPDKPKTSFELCDAKNVTVRVKGSYLDDLHGHITQ